MVFNWTWFCRSSRYACLSQYRRCKWSLLLWSFMNAERSLNICPFSLESGNFLTQEHDTTGMFNRCLSSIIVTGPKGIGTAFVNATKCLFHFFNDHIKVRKHVLCVVLNHYSIYTSQLIYHPANKVV